MLLLYVSYLRSRFPPHIYFDELGRLQLLMTDLFERELYTKEGFKEYTIRSKAMK